MITKVIFPAALLAGALGLGIYGARHLNCGSCCATMALAVEPDKGVPAAPLVPSASAKDEPKEKITLQVGDAAPAITVDKWVKGSAVTGFEKGHVYVVEFWATWCRPCRESIPHLTKVAGAHKDRVTVIGVASSERKGKDGEDKRLEKLEAFVTKQGDDMGYTVAFDGTKKMGVEWMRAAGRQSIPTAFIVGADGKIAWIGEPDDNFDEALEKALAQNKKT